MVVFVRRAVGGGRGAGRTAVDFWFRELGTSPSLIKKWKEGAIRWTEFRRAYRRELQDPAARQAITEIRKLVDKQPATLLCSCEDEARCHRSILKQVILQGTATIAVSRKEGKADPSLRSG